MTNRSQAQLASSEKHWEERFWRKVERIPEAGCWIWMGATSCGYGHVRLQKQCRLAHRVSFELSGGVIPDGMVLDHLCRVRCCVNPAHLEVVTHQININRGIAPQRTREWNAAITHCPQGHPYSGNNLRLTPNGARYCLACRRDMARKYREKRALRIV
jgi:hypothetical protein